MASEAELNCQAGGMACKLYGCPRHIQPYLFGEAEGLFFSGGMRKMAERSDAGRQLWEQPWSPGFDVPDRAGIRCRCAAGALGRGYLAQNKKAQEGCGFCGDEEVNCFHVSKIVQGLCRALWIRVAKRPWLAEKNNGGSVYSCCRTVVAIHAGARTKFAFFAKNDTFNLN